MEGDQMYQNFGMVNAADEKEYNRLYTAWNANNTTAEQLYQHEYQQYRDSKQDALSAAGLQLQENNQVFNQWQAQVNNALNYAQMQNSDYWNQAQLDEDKRQFDLSLAEDQRQFNAQMAYKKSSNGGGGNPEHVKLTNAEVTTLVNKFKEAQGGDAGYEAAYGYLSAIGKSDIDPGVIDSILGSVKKGFSDTQRDSLRNVYIGNGGGDAGKSGTHSYIDSDNGEYWYYDDKMLEDLYSQWDKEITVDQHNWTIKEDNKDKTWFFNNNGKNDVYVNNYGVELTTDQLRTALEGTDLSEKEKEAWIKKLRSQSKK
jgi:hypothetical protein